MTAEPSTAQELFVGVPFEPGAAKNDPILVADNVRRAFGGLVAVDVEHLEVQRGAITALIGPNGAGKTNLLEAISLLSPGRGMRRAAAEEIIRRPEAIGWKVSADLSGHGVALRAEPGQPRTTRIDGKTAPQIALARLARVL